MELILNISSLILIVCGLVFVFIAQTMQTPNHPSTPSFNIRHWKPVWLMKDWFTPKGFKFHLAGWSIFSIGTIMLAVKYLS